MPDSFLRVACVTPKVHLADIDANLQEIRSHLSQLAQQEVQLALFPEMSLTGYSVGDLFHTLPLIHQAWEALIELVKESENIPLTFAVGLPVRGTNCLYNCAAIVSNGQFILLAKSNIPNYNEFYEKRYFHSLSPGETDHFQGHEIHPTGTLIRCGSLCFTAEICEDLWVPNPPSTLACQQGAEIVLNLSASPDQIGKHSYLRNLILQQSARCLCGYAYASAGWGESSTDLVFDPKSFLAECGTMLGETARFTRTDTTLIRDFDLEAISRDRFHITTFAHPGSQPRILTLPEPSGYGKKDNRLMRTIPAHPFVPVDTSGRDERCEEIINIQVSGLARRLDAIHCRNLVIGISGGLDSTLALLVAAKAFDSLNLDRKGILAVTMPGFGTTDRTHLNALELMRLLGVTSKEISIVPAVNQHFNDIGHNPEVHDITYENSQARERTMLLMNLANQCSGIVLGTGDLSELALGWATYNGDHMSMYGVNAGIPKTLVAHLVRYFSSIYPHLSHVLSDIADTPISPELIPATPDGKIAQKTEDLVGPYELHDFFLYYMLRYGFSPRKVFFMARQAFSAEKYDDETIKKWMRVFYKRFFAQQFKRSCLPDGPKVGSVCLSPRGDWRMPSDASSAAFLKELDNL